MDSELFTLEAIQGMPALAVVQYSQKTVPCSKSRNADWKLLMYVQVKVKHDCLRRVTLVLFQEATSLVGLLNLYSIEG